MNPGGPCFETRFLIENSPGNRVSKHGSPGIPGGPCFETRFPGETQKASPRIHTPAFLGEAGFETHLVQGIMNPAEFGRVRLGDFFLSTAPSFKERHTCLVRRVSKHASPRLNRVCSNHQGSLVDRVSKHGPPGIPHWPRFETRSPGAIAF